VAPGHGVGKPGADKRASGERMVSVAGRVQGGKKVDRHTGHKLEADNSRGNLGRPAPGNTRPGSPVGHSLTTAGKDPGAIN